MKYSVTAIALIILSSCTGNIQSANIVLSEPNESSEIRTLTNVHRLSINQSRMLIYNGEERMLVPEGKQVVFEIVDGGEPSFILSDK